MDIAYAVKLIIAEFKMLLYVDFHIHTALSPCANEEMTPNNILNMSKLKGLNSIAITDHNSCENVAVCMSVGKKLDINVIPGMELQTKEDIHVLCLFRNLEDAFRFQEYVYDHLPQIENKPEIFGSQFVFDEQDEIIRENKRLLLTSSNISLDDAFYKVKELNGTFIPAHVDRSSFSVISNLGFVPEYLSINLLEYKNRSFLDNLMKKGLIKNRYNFIKSSDAHNLNDILECEFSIDVKYNDADIIIDKLNNKKTEY